MDYPRSVKTFFAVAKCFTCEYRTRSPAPALSDRYWDGIRATIVVTLPAAIVTRYPLDMSLIMIFVDPVLPLESLMACYVFRKVVLPPQGRDCLETSGMVLTTVLPQNTAFEIELPAQA